MNAAAGAAAGAIAAADERDWKKVVDFFESRGASEPTRAIVLPNDHALSKRILADLLKNGDLQETVGGAYWLDIDRASKRRGLKHRRVGRILTITSILAAIAAVALLASN